MGQFTDAQIATDIGNIFSDLSATGANETVTLTPADGSATSSFNVIRARTLSAKELNETGFGRQYRLSVYALNADGASVAIGDIITMETEGELRVLNPSRGPMLGYVRLDLGDQFAGRA